MKNVTKALAVNALVNTALNTAFFTRYTPDRILDIFVDSLDAIEKSDDYRRYVIDSNVLGLFTAVSNLAVNKYFTGHYIRIWK